jgi:selenocysteine-specific elongation factor
MELVERGDVSATVHSPVLVDSLRHVVDGDPTGLERSGPWVFSSTWLEELERDLRARIALADPLDPGIPPPPEPWASDVLSRLAFERRGAKLYLPGAAPSLGTKGAAAEALERELASAGLQATKVEDDELARFLEAAGSLVRLGNGYAVGPTAYEDAKGLLLAECGASGEITLARFRDLLGVGRRDAQLLLERFDADGLTRRVGDRRVLRRAARST